MKEEIYFTEEFGRQTHSGNKIGPKVDFCYFLKFGLLVFLQIVYSNSLS